MNIRRWILLLLAAALPLAGASACTRERKPWRGKSAIQLAASPAAPATPAPVPTFSGEALPRFTPHITPQVVQQSAPGAAETPLPALETLPPPPTAIPTPAMAATPTLAPVAATYIVQPGETLFDIAQKYHVSLSALAALNNITDPTTIEMGQTLLIPGPR